MIEAVVSDFGGVLTSPLLLAFERVQGRIDIAPEAYAAAMAHSLAHEGVHPLFALERGEITYEDFVGRLERGLQATGGITVSLHDFGDELMGALDPNAELFDHYRALRRDHGLRFALCTNNVREWEPLWRAMLPIDELFEVVVDSAFVGTRKPEPEIYAITLERLGLPAEACAFVDDLEVNVGAAREAGMHGIVFRDNARTIAELASLLA
ncbi:MAG TPA: HAD family phosphatase [Solirubrobacteraceae bacterium]|nr:HAD family phosphatase [Solirubrobacteraceae bacterium]